MLEIFLEYLSSIPSWILAIAACLGLWTWKMKISYERNMEIVDDFHETVHHSLIQLAKSIEFFKILDAYISGYDSAFQVDNNRQNNFQNGLHQLIEEKGQQLSTQLQEILNRVPFQHLCMLITKIRVLNIKNKELAFNCYEQIRWCYEITQQVTSKLGMQSLYWKNPEVEKIMNELYTLKIEELNKHLTEANQFMLEFAKKNYN
ncbi:hypothetical protein L3V83_13790 [Thiotrichales bacterium 19X7-9]|nr:hypothetical protein [Thiotrichales bacterium 19X7-9]